jgi:hypothetical protein
LQYVVVLALDERIGEVQAQRSPAVKPSANVSVGSSTWLLNPEMHERGQPRLAASRARTVKRSAALRAPVATSAAMSPIRGANLAPWPEQGRPG